MSSNPETKSDFYTGPDVSKALHSEGTWYLIRNVVLFANKPAMFTIPEDHFESVIVHRCSKAWLLKSIPDEQGVEKVLARAHWYAVNHYEMHHQCEHCHEQIPKSVQALWLLHNWDHISKNNTQ